MIRLIETGDGASLVKDPLDDDLQKALSPVGKASFVWWINAEGEPPVSMQLTRRYNALVSLYYHRGAPLSMLGWIEQHLVLRSDRRETMDRACTATDLCRYVVGFSPRRRYVTQAQLERCMLSCSSMTPEEAAYLHDQLLGQAGAFADAYRAGYGKENT